MTAHRWAGPLRKLAALTIGLGLGGASGLDAQKIPLELPIAIHLEGSSAETSFEVREAAVYAVNLSFLYDEGAPARSDRNRVWHLVGGSEKDAQTGQWQEPGAPVALEVLLQRQENGIATDIVRQEVVQPRLSSWGNGSLTTRLVAIRLTPGRHHLVVRNLRAAPALQDVGARVGVVRAYMGK